MAGKTKKPAAKKENRGGKRTGAGRKPKNQWGHTRADMLKIADEVAEKEGASIWHVLNRIIYHAPNIRDRLTGIKIHADIVMPKQSESKVEVTKKQAPKIYLPQAKPDPAKVIPIDKKIGGKDGKKITR